jgi:hypothetical protein
MTKAELHELVDRLPDGAVDGAAVLLGEISAGRIDLGDITPTPVIYATTRGRMRRASSSASSGVENDSWAL